MLSTNHNPVLGADRLAGALSAIWFQQMVDSHWPELHHSNTHSSSLPSEPIAILLMACREARDGQCSGECQHVHWFVTISASARPILVKRGLHSQLSANCGELPVLTPSDDPAIQANDKSIGTHSRTRSLSVPQRRDHFNLVTCGWEDVGTVSRTSPVGHPDVSTCASII